MSVSKMSTSAVVALSLLAVPTMSIAAPAAKKLSIAARSGAPIARVGARSVKSNKAIGGTGLIIAVLAGAAVVGGIVVASDNNDSPASN